jgi:hypothetical protein
MGYRPYRGLKEGYPGRGTGENTRWITAGRSSGVHPQNKTTKKEDERETLSKIRRATRPKALLILRIRGEIRPRDRK